MYWCINLNRKLYPLGVYIYCTWVRYMYNYSNTNLLRCCLYLAVVPFILATTARQKMQRSVSTVWSGTSSFMLAMVLKWLTVPLTQWAKVPRFSEGPWGMSSPRTSKTVRGTRAKRRVPRTVFEVRGLHLSQRSRGKGGVLSLYPGYAGLPLEYGFFRKRGILAKIHHTLENVASWEYCFPRCHIFRKCDVSWKTEGWFLKTNFR